MVRADVEAVWGAGVSANMQPRALAVRHPAGHIIGEIVRPVGYRHDPWYQRGEWATNGAKWAFVHEHEGRSAVFAAPGFMPEGVAL